MAIATQKPQTPAEKKAILENALKFGINIGVNNVPITIVSSHASVLVGKDNTQKENAAVVLGLDINKLGDDIDKIKILEELLGFELERFDGADLKDCIEKNLNKITVVNEYDAVPLQLKGAGIKTKPTPKADATSINRAQYAGGGVLSDTGEKKEKELLALKQIKQLNQEWYKTELTYADGLSELLKLMDTNFADNKKFKAAKFKEKDFKKCKNIYTEAKKQADSMAKNLEVLAKFDIDSMDFNHFTDFIDALKIIKADLNKYTNVLAQAAQFSQKLNQSIFKTKDKTANEAIKDLSKYLITPVQRGPRYELLINDICKKLENLDDSKYNKGEFLALQKEIKESIAKINNNMPSRKSKITVSRELIEQIIPEFFEIEKTTGFHQIIIGKDKTDNQVARNLIIEYAQLLQAKDKENLKPENYNEACWEFYNYVIKNDECIKLFKVGSSDINHVKIKNSYNKLKKLVENLSPNVAENYDSGSEYDEAELAEDLSARSSRASSISESSNKNNQYGNNSEKSAQYGKIAEVIAPELAYKSEKDDDIVQSQYGPASERPVSGNQYGKISEKPYEGYEDEDTADTAQYGPASKVSVSANQYGPTSITSTDKARNQYGTTYILKQSASRTKNISPYATPEKLVPDEIIRHFENKFLRKKFNSSPFKTAYKDILKQAVLEESSSQGQLFDIEAYFQHLVSLRNTKLPFTKTTNNDIKRTIVKEYAKRMQILGEKNAHNPRFIELLDDFNLYFESSDCKALFKLDKNGFGYTTFHKSYDKIQNRLAALNNPVISKPDRIKNQIAPNPQHLQEIDNQSAENSSASMGVMENAKVDFINKFIYYVEELKNHDNPKQELMNYIQYLKENDYKDWLYAALNCRFPDASNITFLMAMLDYDFVDDEELFEALWDDDEINRVSDAYHRNLANIAQELNRENVLEFLKNKGITPFPITKLLDVQLNTPLYSNSDIDSDSEFPDEVEQAEYQQDSKQLISQSLPKLVLYTNEMNRQYGLFINYFKHPIGRAYPLVNLIKMAKVNGEGLSKLEDLDFYFEVMSKMYAPDFGKRGMVNNAIDKIGEQIAKLISPSLNSCKRGILLAYAKNLLANFEDTQEYKAKVKDFCDYCNLSNKDFKDLFFDSNRNNKSYNIKRQYNAFTKVMDSLNDKLPAAGIELQVVKDAAQSKRASSVSTASSTKRLDEPNYVDNDELWGSKSSSIASSQASSRNSLTDLSKSNNFFSKIPPVFSSSRSSSSVNSTTDSSSLTNDEMQSAEIAGRARAITPPTKDEKYQFSKESRKSKFNDSNKYCITKTQGKVKDSVRVKVDYAKKEDTAYKTSHDRDAVFVFAKYGSVLKKEKPKLKITGNTRQISTMMAEILAYCSSKEGKKLGFNMPVTIRAAIKQKDGTFESLTFKVDGEGQLVKDEDKDDKFNKMVDKVNNEAARRCKKFDKEQSLRRKGVEGSNRIWEVGRKNKPN